MEKLNEEIKDSTKVKNLVITNIRLKLQTIKQFSSFEDFFEFMTSYNDLDYSVEVLISIWSSEIALIDNIKFDFVELQ